MKYKAENITIIDEDELFVGNVHKSELCSEFVKAMNNFPESIGLLEMAVSRLHINNIEKSEQEYIDEINEFLNRIK